MDGEFIARGVPVEPREAEALRAEVERVGDGVVADAIGLSRFGLARVCARFPVSRGTHVLVRQYVARRGDGR